MRRKLLGGCQPAPVFGQSDRTDTVGASQECISQFTSIFVQSSRHAASLNTDEPVAHNDLQLLVQLSAKDTPSCNYEHRAGPQTDMEPLGDLLFCCYDVWGVATRSMQ